MLLLQDSKLTAIQRPEEVKGGPGSGSLFVDALATRQLSVKFGEGSLTAPPAEVCRKYWAETI
jgi:hypothetical protein